MKSRLRILTVFAGAITLVACASQTNAAELSAEELFDTRIMPIFRSPDPSSCVQCHLSSVDLKDYILPSHEQTFASLRAQGLINVKQPAQSKILELIAMGERDLDQGAKMIHEKMRQAENAAFAAWITASAKDPQLLALPAPPKKAGPESPYAVIRHARKSRVLDSFVRNVWSQRMRCFPCHTPYEIDENNPKHLKAAENHRKAMEKNGLRVSSRLRLFRKTPEATLQYLIEQSRDTPEDRLPLINIDEPAKSLLVLKPTSKLPPRGDDGKFAPPSYIEPVYHMGGLKMHKDDFSYKAFTAWLQDYSRVVKGEYVNVADLPADNWHASKYVIFLREAPKAWANMARVQFFVHAWNETAKEWSDEPVAFTQNSVTPRRSVAGTLFVLPAGKAQAGADWNAEDPTLRPGKYLIKAYIDRRHLLDEDPAALLGKEDYFGQAVIQAHWQKGFPKAERMLGKQFTAQHASQ